jgi:hypothetical protein
MSAHCTDHCPLSFSMPWPFIPLVHFFNLSFNYRSCSYLMNAGLDTFVPWEMVSPLEYCPETVSNCTQPPCPPSKCIAIYAVIPQVNPVQGAHFKHSIPCVNVSWCVSTNCMLAGVLDKLRVLAYQSIQLKVLLTGTFGIPVVPFCSSSMIQRFPYPRCFLLSICFQHVQFFFFKFLNVDFCTDHSQTFDHRSSYRW